MGWRTIEDIDPTHDEARRVRRNRLARKRRWRAAGWIKWPFGGESDTAHLDWILREVGSICYEWQGAGEDTWIRRLED